MRKPGVPHWIIHSSFFDRDTYECSECGNRSERRSKVCPRCGTVLRAAKDDLGWLDEIGKLDLILEDEEI